MSQESNLSAFLKERLSPEHYLEFRAQFTARRLVDLRMKSASIEFDVKRGKYPRGKPFLRAYRIERHFANRTYPVLPPNERILEISQQVLPIANMEILEREEHSVLVRIETYTTPCQRQRLAAAIAKESHFLP